MEAARTGKFPGIRNRVNGLGTLSLSGLPGPLLTKGRSRFQLAGEPGNLGQPRDHPPPDDPRGQKEQERAEYQRKKKEEKERLKQEKANRPERQPGEPDPDIADIVPGPQAPLF